MNATIKNGQLVITIPVNDPMPPSESGKSLLLASTHGAVNLAIDGKVVAVSVNAYVKNPAFVKVGGNGNGHAPAKRTMPAGV
jgi:hypothetical protein